MNQKLRVIRLERNGPADSGMLEMECDSAGLQSPVPTQQVHVYFEDNEVGFSVGAWDAMPMQEAKTIWINLNG